MKKIFLLSTISIFLIILSFQIEAQPVKKNVLLKNEYKKASFFTARSPIKLVQYLTKNDSSDAQKAFNIYTWITHNIKYDINAYKRKKEFSIKPSKILKRRKATSYGYAHLYQRLTDIAGLTTKVIYGYKREGNHIKEFQFYQSNHAWNGIKLGEEWHLIAPMEGSGYFEHKESWFVKFKNRLFKKTYIKNQYKFTQQSNINYFLIDPEKLIKNNLPTDPNWQLVQYPISLKTFESNEWQGYQNIPDSSYNNLKKSYLDYSRKLNPYANQSFLQYLNNIGQNESIFNKGNYEKLAKASFFNATNGSKSARKKGNNKSDIKSIIEEYNTAISYAKRNRANIKKVSKEIYNDVKNKIGKDINSHYKKRKKTNEKQLALSSKRYSKSNENIEKLSNNLESHSLRTAKRKYIKLNRGRFSKYENKTQLKKNQQLISENHELQKRLIDTIAAQSSKLKNLYVLKRNTQKKITPVNDQLNLLIQIANGDIFQNESIIKIVKVYHQIEKKGQLADSLYKELKSYNDSIKNIKNSIRRNQVTIIGNASTNQKLIKANYVLSKGKIFQDSLHNSYNETIENVLNHKTTLYEIYFNEIKNDSFYYQMSFDTLSKQSEILEKNEQLINAYRNYVLSVIKFNEAKSVSSMSKIISTSNRQLGSLRKSISKH